MSNGPHPRRIASFRLSCTLKSFPFVICLQRSLNSYIQITLQESVKELVSINNNNSSIQLKSQPCGLIHISKQTACLAT